MIRYLAILFVAQFCACSARSSSTSPNVDHQGDRPQPCARPRVLSGYMDDSGPRGANRRFLHSGVDFAADVGTKVIAAADGIVVSILEDEDTGHIVQIYHPRMDAFGSYVHLQKAIVEVGESISRGQKIGTVGYFKESGNQPHLHWELCGLRPCNGRLQRAVDPQEASIPCFASNQSHSAQLSLPLSCCDRAVTHPRRGPFDDWLRLRVEMLEVKLSAPGGAGEWDNKATDIDRGCSYLFTGRGEPLLAPHARLAAGPCPAWQGVTSSTTNKKNNLPDLLVGLSGEGLSTLWSGIAWNRIDVASFYEFQFPRRGIPPSGLVLAVLDQDGQRHGMRDVITRVHLSRDIIDEMVLDTTQRTFAADGLGLNALKLRATRAPNPTAYHSATIHVAHGFGRTPVHATAGSVIEIRASGQYALGVGFESVHPEGLIGHESGKRELFERARFGSAIAAVVNEFGAIHAVEVGDCIRVVAAYDGQVMVGVNDREDSDNVGAISFLVSIDPPNDASWRNPGYAMPCTVIPAKHPASNSAKVTLASARQSMTACAEWFRLRSLKGALRVSRDGRVEAVSIVSKAMPAAIRCASQVFESSKFPSARRPYTVPVSFAFDLSP